MMYYELDYLESIQNIPGGEKWARIITIHPIDFRGLKSQFLNYFHHFLRSQSDSTFERIRKAVTYKDLGYAKNVIMTHPP